jgi:hypothetical protein
LNNAESVVTKEMANFVAFGTQWKQGWDSPTDEETLLSEKTNHHTQTGTELTTEDAWKRLPSFQVFSMTLVF